MAGTCPAGTWTNGVYTTTPLSADCNVIFNTLQAVRVTTTVTGSVSISPNAYYVAVGSHLEFNVTVPGGYTIGTPTGTCSAGTWSSGVYSVEPVNASCSIAFAATLTTPTVTIPRLNTTGLTTTGGNTIVTLSWVAPTDTTTLAANQNYTVCASGPDPATGTFINANQVLAGTRCTKTTGTTTASFTVPAGHAYYFNVVVTNAGGGQTAYRPKGEFADASLVYYWPFEGNTDDVVSGLNMSAASYQSVSAATPTLVTDHFNDPDGAYDFALGSDQCLRSSGILAASVTGTSSRTVTFWMRSTDQTFATQAVLGIGGNSANLTTNDRFGMYGAENGNWKMWLRGEDFTTTAPVYYYSSWDMWALTYTSAGTVAAVYRDGILVGQKTSFTTPPNTNQGPLYVGCGVDGTNGGLGHLTDFFAGQVSGIRIFDRVLCDTMATNGCSGTAGEIENLYNVQH